MKVKNLFFICLLFLTTFSLASKAEKLEYYEIRVFHLENQEQGNLMDEYLKNAFIPALHRYKIENIGVFKAADKNDTVLNKRIYLLIPYKSLNQFNGLSEHLKKDKEYNQLGKAYIDAVHTNPPYKRIESTLLRAFSHMPSLMKPLLKGEKADRIYELRSYESPTEKLYNNKVHMFNEGGEIQIFKRLGFNPVFFGEVLTGSSMPNLMYMTSFENKASRDLLWKEFARDADWKRLSSMPFYKNNMNRAVKIFLTPASYSDI